MGSLGCLPYMTRTERTHSMSAISAGTAAGLMEYCDFLIEKGYVSGAAVNPWKSATKQVLQTVEGEGYLSTDVQSLDLDDLMERYATLSRGNVKQETLEAYRTRVRRALDSYRQYLADPSGWRPPTPRAPRTRTSSSQERPKTTNGNGATAHTGDQNGNGNGITVIDYPFPLQSGQMAHVRLPSMLEKEDADRLGRFLQTLVFEPQRGIPAQTGEGSNE